MKTEDYRKILHEDIEIACSVNNSTEGEEFFSYAAGLLMNGEEFDEFIECRCEGTTRRGGNYRIDGYSMNETDGSCCVLVSDYHGPGTEDGVKAKDIEIEFKKIRYFVEESIRNELFKEIKNSAAMEFSRDLYFDHDQITKYRFYLLTDAYNRQRSKTIKDQSLDGKTVELNVWDITRLYDLVSSQTQRESVEISFSEFGIEGIPCVKAVDHRNIIADIDVSPVAEQEPDPDAVPENVITYSSYLAVVPGEILSQLYLDYGAKLLEGNVRSFLSAKGKVNKSIQATIKNYPEMFFAYNNGIAATATQIETRRTDEGLVITWIKDLQIVNGGQTTASIANTFLTAKKNEHVDLSRIAIPMKLSVLDHSMAEKIIPKISEYSNSQNKVEASDFFSNHPFHVRMEEHSRKTPVPSKGGNQFQQYWFYERTRGQYNQGKMKLTGKKAELKKYTDRYPEKNIITMLDLAKYMELYKCRPDIVSKGKQKMLQYFAEEIKTTWEKSNTQYNEWYFRRVVAIALIYRKTDEIIKQSPWYKESRSYKANVIAYTMSLIFWHISKEKNSELDFKRIWNDQAVYEELEDQIDILQYEVYKFITGSRSVANVTEWCKQEACWKRAQERIWTITDAFLATLVSKDESEAENKEDKKKQELANEVNALNEIYLRGQSYWKTMLEWGQSRRMLTGKEISVISMTVNMFVTGRLISDKQAQVVMNARKRLIANGMPMQF